MQPPFEIRLAELLDQLAESGAVTIVETEVVAVSGLTADAASTLCALVGGSWPLAIEDSDGGPTGTDQIDGAFEPFRLVITKPEIEGDRLRLLTLSGFRQALARSDLPGVIELARCCAPFETQAFGAFGWGGGPSEQRVAVTQRSPRELVKETGATRVAPLDLRRWLLTSELPASDDATFLTWAELAAINVPRSLVSEIAQDGKLILKGVMRLQIEPPDATTYASIGREGFSALQLAASWVYSNDREAETRFGLFVNEMTRSASNNVSCAECFGACADALEGAKLAFQLSLEGLSKDSMKALSDLRKSLSDETSKLSDITRQLALAVAGSVFLGMGIILTKQTSSISFIGIFLFGLVLALYVAFVALSGHQYIKLQRDIRTEWRRILYRFMADSEYKKMVDDPASKAEANFYDACVIGALAILMLLAAMCFMFA